MRKTVVAICSVILALMMMLGGCSCNPPIILSFNNDFNGGKPNSANDLNSTYHEKLTYKVTYEKDYLSASIDPSLKEADLPEYTNGTYVMEFFGDVTLPEGIGDNIKFDGDKYHLTTRMDIDVKAGDKVFHDVLMTDSYFFSSGHAFAPIYSNVKMKNTYIKMNKKDGKLVPDGEQVLYNYTTTYTSKDYTITRYIHNGKQEDIVAFDMDNFDNSKLTLVSDPETYKYTIKEAIDNTELLFAIRNTGLAKDRATTVPVISPIYGIPKKITIKNVSESQKTLTSPINYNGVNATEEIPVKNIQFVLAGSSNIGSAQYVTLQKEATANLPYRALPVEYASAIAEFNYQKRLGVLVYKLEQVDFAE